MKTLLYVFVGFLALTTKSVFAYNGKIITLPDSRVAVVASGDLEGASVGSYSLAIYTNSDLIDFVVGAIFPRDGSIFMDNGEPRVEFADMNGDGKEEIVITKLTAGSGAYLEVDILSIEDKSIKLLARETGEDKTAILKILEKKLKNKDH
ncbi:PliI family lysozyme inhibitor of I-type lysozyme [Neisseria sp. Ec49-e6-T10]|uniref:PliI family lysozyme inhibitor of I-type lysozyme n=1 Tax=Neisseria sp. Ec49-e6-T10 TaxID=3140744 RepID=UPI003EBAB7D9